MGLFLPIIWYSSVQKQFLHSIPWSKWYHKMYAIILEPSDLLYTSKRLISILFSSIFKVPFHAPWCDHTIPLTSLLDTYLLLFDGCCELFQHNNNQLTTIPCFSKLGHLNPNWLKSRKNAIFDHYIDTLLPIMVHKSSKLHSCSLSIAVNIVSTSQGHLDCSWESTDPHSVFFCLIYSTSIFMPILDMQFNDTISDQTMNAFKVITSTQPSHKYSWCYLNSWRLRPAGIPLKNYPPAQFRSFYIWPPYRSAVFTSKADLI